MNTNTEFLTALQLSDSFLPVGSYTSSYGLETFVQENLVQTPDDLEALLKDYLRHQIGPCDVVAISNTYDASKETDLDRIIEIDRQYHAMQLPKEFRESSTKSGTQLANLMDDINDFDILNDYTSEIGDRAYGHYPISLSVVSSMFNIPKDNVCLMYTYSFITGLLGVAQRLFELGHTDLQEILQNLRATTVEIVEKNRNLVEMQSFTPLIDIMGMKHERADKRLFSS